MTQIALATDAIEVPTCLGQPTSCDVILYLNPQPPGSAQREMPPRSEEDEGGGWEGVGGGGGGSRQVQITSLHSFGTGGDFFPAGLRGPGLSWAARLPTSISCSLLGSVSLSLPAPSPRSSPPPRPAGPLLGLLLYLEQHLLAAPGDHAGSRPLLEPGSRGWSHGQAGRSGRLYFYPEHPQGQLLLRAALDFSPLLAAREFREGGEVGGGGGEKH